MPGVESWEGWERLSDPAPIIGCEDSLERSGRPLDVNMHSGFTSSNGNVHTSRLNSPRNT